ncbi:hypothetical protein RB195_025561 [Necator americanus]|uniref:Uncharacterized protein n=1 Tax=Necator americanus TaxID=51031 RepID=A0ABR1ESV0_NECAM
MEKPVVDPEGDQRTDPHQAGNPSTDPAKLQEETLITALTQQVALLECDQLEDPQQFVTHISTSLDTFHIPSSKASHCYGTYLYQRASLLALDDEI